MKEINKKNLLGINLSDTTLENALEFITTSLQKGKEKYYIVTPNTEIFMLAKKDPAYKKIINEAKLALPDGVGVTWAGRMLGIPLRERIPGVELLENLCREAAEKPITVGFFGGKQNVAQRSAECLIQKYPGLRVSFAVEDWELVKGLGLETSMDKGKRSKVRPKTKTQDYTGSQALKPYPNKMSADILFVALGPPKQEKWIAKNLSKIDVKVAIGVGGAFDFISGNVPRAPKWLRNLGLEWLFRLIIQPWRIKRQMTIPKFIFWVLSEKTKMLFML